MLPLAAVACAELFEKYYKTSVEVLPIIVNRIRKLGSIIEASLSMFLSCMVYVRNGRFIVTCVLHFR